MQNQDFILEEGRKELEKYHKAIEGNKEYVKEKLAENPNYFKDLSKGQNPSYLLIGCSDSRVPPNELTKTEPGEIFIHRNIANLILPTDLNMNCVLQYAVEHLKVQNIVVMGHTCCGGVKAAMQQESVGSLLDLWLNQIKIVYEKHQEIVDSFDDPDDRINSLCFMNVREQVSNIWRSPIVQKSWQMGHPIMVHGWLFRVETGFIEEVSIDQSIPDEMSKIFKLKFKRELFFSEKDKQSSKADSPLGTPRKAKTGRFQRMQSKLEFEVKHNEIESLGKHNEFDSMGNLNNQFDDCVFPSKTT